MFSKINKFGGTRSIFSPFVFNRFEDHLYSYSSTSSDECIWHPKNVRRQTPLHHCNILSEDELYEFTPDLSSSEFATETSESSADSMRTAINDMLTEDIFGYVNGLENDRSQTMYRFHVSSSESTCASTIGFLDELFGDSSIERAENSQNAKAAVDKLKNTNTTGSNQIRRLIPGTLLREKFSAHTRPSSGLSSFESISDSKTPAERVGDDEALTFGKKSSNEPSLALCDGIIIRNPKSSRKSLTSALDYTNTELDHSLPVVKEILDSIVKEIEGSNQMDESSEDDVDISFIVSEFHRRFNPTRQMIGTSPDSCDKRKTLALTNTSTGLESIVRKSVSDMTSRVSSVEQDKLFGVWLELNAPILTMNDFEEPQRLRCRKSEANNETTVVPFRARNNDTKVNFDAEVQSIIQEFHRRVNRFH